MIRIAITEAAFDAIAATLPLGSVGFDREFTVKGERRRRRSTPTSRACRVGVARRFYPKLAK
jgi:hypothetical protein